jgi:hypothetical protein
MVRSLAVMAGRALASVMVWPTSAGSNGMVSPGMAAVRAARSEPVPASMPVVTGMVAGTQRRSRTSKAGRKDRREPPRAARRGGREADGLREKNGYDSMMRPPAQGKPVPCPAPPDVQPTRLGAEATSVGRDKSGARAVYDGIYEPAG